MEKRKGHGKGMSHDKEDNDYDDDGTRYRVPRRMRSRTRQFSKQ